MTRAGACRTLAAGALAIGVPPPARAATSATVNVAVTRSADAVPFFYAVQDGLFAKADLDVKYSAMASGGAISAALLGRAADIGFSNVQTLVVAHNRNIAFGIVAGGGRYDNATPTTALVVADGSPIAHAKDLEGKVVAVGSLQDLQSLSVSSWMAQNGANASAVRFIESPASAALALLQQKRADAIVVSEPNLENARANGAHILAPVYSAIAPRFLVSCWFATNDWAKTNAAAAERFGAVMRRASAYANAHPEAMDALIHDYASIPLATLRAMAHARQADAVRPADVQPVIDAAARFKIIDKPFPASDIIVGS